MAAARLALINLIAKIHRFVLLSAALLTDHVGLPAAFSLVRGIDPRASHITAPSTRVVYRALVHPPWLLPLLPPQPL